MSVFNSLTFSVRRFAAGSYVKGVWTPSSTTPTSLTIKGTWHPGTAERFQTLLEGKRVRGIGELISGSALKTVDLATKTPADQVQIGNEWWTVLQASPWQNGIIPHYEYVLILPKEGGE